MKTLTYKAEIWEQICNSNDIERNRINMLEHVRRCARVCYQTPSKNDELPVEDWINKVILSKKNKDSNHTSVLSHGAIYLSFDYKTNRKLHSFYSRLPKQYCHVNTVNGICFVSTNYRVIYDYDRYDDLRWFTPCTKWHEPIITVSMISSIDINREFNRHTFNWPSEESTRYCNYNKDKFDNQISVIKPSSILSLDRMDSSSLVKYCNDVAFDKTCYWEALDYYVFSLIVSEFVYNKLISLGWKPQFARKVLPLCTKSQLVHTTFLSHWKRFIAIRANGLAGTPHPDAMYLASMIETCIKNKGFKL